MKNKLLSLLTSGVAILTLCACSNKSNDVTPVIPKDGKYEEFEFKGQGYLDRDYIALKNLVFNLSVGESKQVSVDSFPTSYALNSLEFDSVDSEIASVDASGKITANKKGITDVLVRSKDGTFSNYVRVVVSEISNKGDMQSTLDSIGAVYNDEGYVPAKRVIRYEFSKEMYYCEGVADHGFEGFEVIAYDSNEGYLYIEGPSLYHKTPGGTPELKDGTWIMYPINYGVMTRLIHITPTSKNYFDINTAAYNGNYDAIMRDIMNFFFVSGEKIITDLLSDYDGKEDFFDFQDYSATKYYSVDSNTIAYTYHQERDDTVSPDDEINYVDIPAETPYHEVMDLTLVNSNNRCVGYEIDAQMIYERDGQNWYRSFYRSQLFGDDFKVEKIQNPKDNGYSYVDSIYDL